MTIDDTEFCSWQVTCETEGCENQNIPLIILGTIEGFQAICGICNTPISNYQKEALQ